jgi:hypothetical protein
MYWIALSVCALSVCALSVCAQAGEVLFSPFCLLILRVDFAVCCL